MAPEIHLKEAYNGQSVDVFALGVVLFQMVAGTPPFMKAMDEDLFYRQIKEKSELFWKVHQKDIGKFDKDFKSLFTGMVAFDQKERLSLTEVLDHPWIKGEVSSQIEIQQEMNKRYDVIKK